MQFVFRIKIQLKYIKIYIIVLLIIVCLCWQFQSIIFLNVDIVFSDDLGFSLEYDETFYL